MLAVFSLKTEVAHVLMWVVPTWVSIVVQEEDAELPGLSHPPLECGDT